MNSKEIRKAKKDALRTARALRKRYGRGVVRIFPYWNELNGWYASVEVHPGKGIFYETTSPGTHCSPTKIRRLCKRIRES